MIRNRFDIPPQILILAFCGATLCSGGVISVGVLSFDQLIPAGGGSPGVNGFTISNLSGLFALPPDFPVAAASHLIPLFLP